MTIMLEHFEKGGYECMASNLNGTAKSYHGLAKPQLSPGNG